MMFTLHSFIQIAKLKKIRKGYVFHYTLEFILDILQ